jgi:hypothetical protein
MVNDGRVKLINRGNAKKDIEDRLGEVRKRVVELLKQMGARMREKFRVMTVQRYKDTHNGRHPELDGHQVIVKEMNNVQHEVIIFRTLPEGEWDLEYYEDRSVRQREEVDDGEGMLDSKQQARKINAIAKSLRVAEEGADLPLLDIMQMVGSAASLGTVDEFEEPGAEGGESADSGHSSIEDDDAMLGSILGSSHQKSHARASRGQRGQKEKPNGKKHSLRGGKQGGAYGGGDRCKSFPQAKKVGGAADKKVVGAADKKVGGAADIKKTISASSVGLNIEVYLAKEGVPALVEKISKAKEHLAPFQEIATSSTKLAELQHDLAKACLALRACHTDSIAAFWKVAKRTNPPGEAVEKLQAIRDKVNWLWTLCVAFQAREVTAIKHDKAMDALKELDALNEEVPIAFRSLAYLSSIAELLHYSRFDDILELLVKADVGNKKIESSEKKKLDVFFAEEYLLKVLGQVQGLESSSEKDAQHILKGVHFLSTMLKAHVRKPDCVLGGDWSSFEDAQALVHVLSVSRETSVDDADAALQKFKDLQDNPGLFQAMKAAGCLGVVLKAIIIRVEEIRKQSKSKDALVPLAVAMTTVQQALLDNSSVPADHAGSFERAVEAAVQFMDGQETDEARQAARKRVLDLVHQSTDVCKFCRARSLKVVDDVVSEISKLDKNNNDALANVCRVPAVSACSDNLRRLIDVAGCLRFAKTQDAGREFHEAEQFIKNARADMTLLSDTHNNLIGMVERFAAFRREPSKSTLTAYFAKHAASLTQVSRANDEDMKNDITKIFEKMDACLDVKADVQPIYMDEMRSYYEKFVVVLRSVSDVIRADGPVEDQRKLCTEAIGAFKSQRHQVMQLVNWSPKMEDDKMFLSIADSICDVAGRHELFASLSATAGLLKGRKKKPEKVARKFFEGNQKLYDTLEALNNRILQGGSLATTLSARLADDEICAKFADCLVDLNQKARACACLKPHAYCTSHTTAGRAKQCFGVLFTCNQTITSPIICV